MKTISLLLLLITTPFLVLSQTPTFDALNDDCVRIVVACLEVCKGVSDDDAKIQCINECRQLYVNCTNAPSGPGSDPGSSTEASTFESFDQILTSMGFDKKFHFLSVAPNPSHGKFSVQISSWPENGQADIVLLNSLGQTIEQKHLEIRALTPSNIDFEISLPPGLYIVRVELQGNNFFRKIIIK